MARKTVHGTRGNASAKCSHCEREGEVFLAYSCKTLCPAHFIQMFDKRFRKTVRMNKMLEKGDKVAVGLSGGKDSSVLLHSLFELKKDLPFELFAITIDEGIAGYRPRTMVPAKTECEKLGVEQHVYSFKELCGKSLDELVGKGFRGENTRRRREEKDGKISERVEKDDRGRGDGDDLNGKKTGGALPCSQCGVLRRYALNKAAKELGATKLAIGHNLDDMAQTVIMNIMKNEPERLARLNDPIVRNQRFVPRIRPLMMTPEREIAIYAIMKRIKLERVECPYAHTAFRGHVRKMLNETEEKYPGTKFKIMGSFLGIEDALHSKYSIGAAIRECPSCGEPCSGERCMFCRMIGAK